MNRRTNANVRAMEKMREDSRAAGGYSLPCQQFAKDWIDRGGVWKPFVGAFDPRSIM